MSFLQSAIQFIIDGGFFMYIILACLAFGLAIAMERAKKLSGMDVDGPSFMNELQRYVLSNDIQGAIRVCSGSNGALPKVLKSGLKRSNQSSEQIQNALDATALEVIPKLEQRLPYLQLIANLSTLFGLLGTIQGLIQSFAAISAADPSQKAEVLSSGIAIAMYTTAMGLGSAIIVMIIHAFLSAKAEKIVGEIDEYAVKLLDLIGTKKVED
jgi:biopolymer transport protein ExbB